MICLCLRCKFRNSIKTIKFSDVQDPTNWNIPPDCGVIDIPFAYGHPIDMIKAIIRFMYENPNFPA